MDCSEGSKDKTGCPPPLSDAEKMRNHILRIAAVGQEAIKVSELGVSEVADRYAKKPVEVKAAAGNEAEAKKTPAEREADGKALGDAAKAVQKQKERQNAMSNGESWTVGMPTNVVDGDNKAPILQNTTVYAQKK